MSVLYPRSTGTKEIGKIIVKENKIDDPAILLLPDLSKYLEDKYSSKIVGKKLNGIESDQKLYSKDESALLEEKEVKKISSDYYGQADYVLGIKTIRWGFVTLPFNEKEYAVIYHLNLKLIDLNSKKVILEKVCSANNFPVNHYSYEELLGHKAKLMKSVFEKVANYCSNELKKEITNLQNFKK